MDEFDAYKNDKNADVIIVLNTAPLFLDGKKFGFTKSYDLYKYDFKHKYNIVCNIKSIFQKRNGEFVELKDKDFYTVINQLYSIKEYGIDFSMDNFYEKLYDRVITEIPKGLFNIGNPGILCYANSLLQCLFTVKSFVISICKEMKESRIINESDNYVNLIKILNYAFTELLMPRDESIYENKFMEYQKQCKSGIAFNVREGNDPYTGSQDPTEIFEKIIKVIKNSKGKKIINSFFNKEKDIPINYFRIGVKNNNLMILDNAISLHFRNSEIGNYYPDTLVCIFSPGNETITRNIHLLNKNSYYVILNIIKTNKGEYKSIFNVNSYYNDELKKTRIYLDKNFSAELKNISGIQLNNIYLRLNDYNIVIDLARKKTTWKELSYRPGNETARLFLQKYMNITNISTELYPELEVEFNSDNATDVSLEKTLFFGSDLTSEKARTLQEKPPFEEIFTIISKGLANAYMDSYTNILVNNLIPQEELQKIITLQKENKIPEYINFHREYVSTELREIIEESVFKYKINDQHSYKLKAFLKQVSTYATHYIAFVKHGDQWYKVDDYKSTPVNIFEIIKEAFTGYMFFFERFDTIKIPH
jgi:hypothetical protein